MPQFAIAAYASVALIFTGSTSQKLETPRPEPEFYIKVEIQGPLSQAAVLSAVIKGHVLHFSGRVAGQTGHGTGPLQGGEPEGDETRLRTGRQLPLVLPRHGGPAPG
jgi:hypothetical protein